MTLTSNTGDSKTYRSVVELKTRTAKKEEEEKLVVRVAKGEEANLTCAATDDHEAALKRVWKKEGRTVEADGAKVKLEEEGKVMTVAHVEPEDAGSYACVVLTEKGMTEFTIRLEVEQKAVLEVDERCRGAASSVPKITSLLRLPSSTEQKDGDDNDTTSVVVRVGWTVQQGQEELSSLLDLCYEGAVLALWTNETESDFQEKTLELSPERRETTDVAGLQSGVGYYVQVNLASPLGLYVYGETRSFVVNNLEEAAEDDLESEESGSLTSAETALAASLGSLAAILVLASAAFLYCKRRREASRWPTGADRGGILSSCDCCLSASTSSSYPKRSGGGSGRKRRKGRIVGSPLDVYDGDVLQAAPISPGDFMRNLAPQWPEPEPGAAAVEVMVEGGEEEEEMRPPHPTERDAFLQLPNGGGSLSVPSRYNFITIYILVIL